MKRLDSEARKLKIIDSALQVFAEVGLSGAKTKDLATAANVSEALIFKHFSGKEELYRCVQDHLCRKGRDVVSELNKREPSTHLLIDGLYFLTFSLLMTAKAYEEQHRNTCRFIVRSILDEDGFTDNYLKENVDVWIPFLKANIAASIQAGDAADIGADEDEIFFIHHMLFATDFFKKTAYGSKLPKPKLIDKAFRFAVRGLGISDTALDRYYDAKAYFSKLNQLFLEENR